MMTHNDENSKAEIEHDMLQWKLGEKDVEKDRKKRFEKLWNGDGFMYYGQHITLDMVFEDILNDRWDEDINETILKYAMDYPESEWYKLVEEYVEDFVEHFEEA